MRRLIPVWGNLDLARWPCAARRPAPALAAMNVKATRDSATSGPRRGSSGAYLDVMRSGACKYASTSQQRKRRRQRRSRDSRRPASISRRMLFSDNPVAVLTSSRVSKVFPRMGMVCNFQVGRRRERTARGGSRSDRREIGRGGGRAAQGGPC